VSYDDAWIGPNSADADCHYGDHFWQTNGYCSNCHAFNAGWLQYQAYEKAEKDGRAHFGHYHRTLEAKARCRATPDAEWIEAYGESEVAV
jgi:hypothetical protein